MFGMIIKNAFGLVVMTGCSCILFAMVLQSCVLKQIVGGAFACLKITSTCA
ncbi:hypothetical protein BLGI_4959 [Brevibacillus laterosporus GI-9]|nr:hypothetical protein BLGI_4959 [Brevibacillus laterosporus GI-9]